VLYVEDDESNRWLRCSIFERYFPQLPIDVSHRGSDALGVLADTRPRLVLLDGYLGDMTAADFVGAYREQAEGELPPIVVVSGSLPPDSATSIAGVVEHVMKPFRIPDLVALVSRVLQEAPAR
jgi:CheY-like chemotaxis protein